MPPWSLAFAAMASVQLGSALSVPLLGTVCAAGTAWLRLSIGALFFLAVARRPLRHIRRADVPGQVGLGISAGLVTSPFLATIVRIPLGTAVAIEFLGPLTVAALRSHDIRALRWPALALSGVVVLTQPWQGAIDPAGVGYAALAAVGWTAYILLTQHIGDRFDGIGYLSLTVPIAAATAANVAIPQAAGNLTLGVLVLAPRPTTVQFASILLIITAGTAAQGARRRHPPAATDDPIPDRRAIQTAPGWQRPSPGNRCW